MSQYFSFYLARRDNEGKYHFVAPFSRNDNGEFEPKSLLTRSRSFIDKNEFEAMAFEKVALDKMDEYLYKLCKNVGFHDEEYSTGWAIPYKSIVSAGSRAGIYRGYVSPEELKYLVENKYWTESKWDIDLTPAEVVAEQGKGDKVSVAFTAYTDTSYYAHILTQSIEEIVPWDEKEQKNYYFIFETEY